MEMMEDVFPLRMLVSNKELERSLLSFDEMTDAVSISCKIFSAISTASGMPVTCPPAACMLTSTAGFAHAEADGPALDIRDALLMLDRKEDDGP